MNVYKYKQLIAANIIAAILEFENEKINTQILSLKIFEQYQFIKNNHSIENKHLWHFLSILKFNTKNVNFNLVDKINFDVNESQDRQSSGSYG